MQVRVENKERHTEVVFPMSDKDMHYQMKKIGVTEVQPCCRIFVKDSPTLNSLNGQTVKLDELNFLAKRLEAFNEYQREVFSMAAKAYEAKELKSLINLTYSLHGLSFLTDLRDCRQVGEQLYRDMHPAMQNWQNVDFRDYALRVLAQRKTRFFLEGVLVDQGFQMQQVYDGRTFPELQHLEKETVAVVKLKNKAGEEESLYFPTDMWAVEKAKARLSVQTLGDCTVKEIRSTRLSQTLLPFPGEIQNGRSMVLFHEMCQAVCLFSPEEMEHLAMAASFIQAKNFADLTYLAKHLNEFSFFHQIHSDEEYGRMFFLEQVEVDALLLPYLDFAELAKAERQQQMADSGYVDAGLVGTARAREEYQTYRGEFADPLERNAMPHAEYCLYNALSGTFFQKEEGSQKELIPYEEDIKRAILEMEQVEKEPRGLVHFFDQKQLAEKVLCTFPKVQLIRGELFGVLACSICQPLTEEDVEELKHAWQKELEGGWGKAFGQKSIATKEGELFVRFQGEESMWGIMTEEELDRTWKQDFMQIL